MNWWVVTASKDNVIHRAEVCEERALGWVREELAESGIYDNIQAVPATCHWTAEIRFPTEPNDICGIARW